MQGPYISDIRSIYPKKKFPSAVIYISPFPISPH